MKKDTTVIHWRGTSLSILLMNLTKIQQVKQARLLRRFDEIIIREKN